MKRAEFFVFLEMPKNMTSIDAEETFSFSIRGSEYIIIYKKHPVYDPAFQEGEGYEKKQDILSHHYGISARHADVLRKRQDQ